MNARLLTTAALVSVLSAAVLPAKAADPELLNLVMPDAKVLAGVNVDQAKTSPMGQYVLNQIQSSGNAIELQKFAALTGFDPTRDVHEVLVATNAGPNEKSGLFLARGNFDPARISAFLASHNAATSTYNGVTIVGDPKGQGGVAFLSPTLAAGGDLANLKAAIDRQRTPTSLPAAVAVRVNQWSASQDAWAITTVPPSSFNILPGMPPMPGAGANQNPIQNAFTGIQHLAGGVKFGANVVVTGQVQASTAQDATQLGDTLKLLASLAQLQANGDPNVLALAQSLKVDTAASVLNLSLSLPQDQIVALMKQGPKKAAPKQLNKK